MSELQSIRLIWRADERHGTGDCFVLSSNARSEGSTLSDRLLYTSTPQDNSAIEELSLVALRAGMDVPSSGSLPEGSVGTVVSVYNAGEAYPVEFTRPFPALVTLAAAQVAAMTGATRADFDAASRDLLHRSR